MLFEFRGETFFLGGTDWNIQRKVLYILFHRFTSVEKVTLEGQLTGTGAKSRIIITLFNFRRKSIFERILCPWKTTRRGIREREMGRVLSFVADTCFVCIYVNRDTCYIHCVIEVTKSCSVYANRRFNWFVFARINSAKYRLLRIRNSIYLPRLTLNNK